MEQVLVLFPHGSLLVLQKELVMLHSYFPQLLEAFMVFTLQVQAQELAIQVLEQELA